MTCEQHPEWCTRVHRPGANPARLAHEHVRRVGKNQRLGFWLCEPWDQMPDGYCSVNIDAYFGSTRLILRPDEMRSLGAKLVELADVIEHMPRRAGLRVPA